MTVVLCAVEGDDNVGDGNVRRSAVVVSVDRLFIAQADAFDSVQKLSLIHI